MEEAFIEKIDKKEEKWWSWQERKWHWKPETIVLLGGYPKGKVLVTEDPAKHPLFPVFQFV